MGWRSYPPCGLVGCLRQRGTARWCGRVSPACRWVRRAVVTSARGRGEGTEGAAAATLHLAPSSRHVGLAAVFCTPFLLRRVRLASVVRARRGHLPLQHSCRAAPAAARSAWGSRRQQPHGTARRKATTASPRRIAHKRELQCQAETSPVGLVCWNLNSREQESVFIATAGFAIKMTVPRRGLP